ncbi:hypothetical protein [Sulfurimonas sp. HSL-1716]|uniref:hypothetical protein n=1 Tax=Hydrocurvibacter sulfurireducens TaxID=3131937 RepID=UPI0031F83DD2
MYRFNEIETLENTQEKVQSNCVYGEEDDNWGEGCCEDELMDDDFYEREQCDE